MTLVDGDTVIFHLTAGIRASPLSRRGDFMATVKVNAEKLIETEYRFRWWVTVDKMDMDGGADDDEKSFFRLAPVPDTEENRERIRAALRGMTRMMPSFERHHEESGEWTPEVFVHEVMQRGPARIQTTFERLPK